MKNIQDLRDDEELRDIFTKLERFYADLKNLDTLLPDFAEVEVKVYTSDPREVVVEAIDREQECRQSESEPRKPVPQGASTF